MPFANLSGDPGQDYLVDALTDELTTSLARLRYTFVIAHNTAMTFKGKPVGAKVIGKELGVRYVLESSVQPSGDQMRVNAQFIAADSGSHVWAEQFDTPRADLSQMQDTIVALVASLALAGHDAEAREALQRYLAQSRDAGGRQEHKLNGSAWNIRGCRLAAVDWPVSSELARNMRTSTGVCSS
jgi:TolB-like protein